MSFAQPFQSYQPYGSQTTRSEAKKPFSSTVDFSDQSYEMPFFVDVEPATMKPGGSVARKPLAVQPITNAPQSIPKQSPDDRNTKIPQGNTSPVMTKGPEKGMRCITSRIYLANRTRSPTTTSAQTDVQGQPGRISGKLRIPLHAKLLHRTDSVEPQLLPMAQPRPTLHQLEKFQARATLATRIRRMRKVDIDEACPSFPTEGRAKRNPLDLFFLHVRKRTSKVAVGILQGADAPADPTVTRNIQRRQGEV